MRCLEEHKGTPPVAAATLPARWDVSCDVNCDLNILIRLVDNFVPACGSFFDTLLRRSQREELLFSKM